MSKRKEERAYYYDVDENGRDVMVWADGKTTTIDLDRMPDITRDQCTRHGAKQKCADGLSRAETVAAKRAIAEGVLDGLYQGIWAQRASGIPAEVYAHALVDCELTLTDDVELATTKVQALMDDDSKESTKALNAIKTHEKVKQWLIDNGYRQPPKAKGLNLDF